MRTDSRLHEDHGTRGVHEPGGPRTRTPPGAHLKYILTETGLGYRFADLPDVDARTGRGSQRPSPSVPRSSPGRGDLPEERGIVFTHARPRHPLRVGKGAFLCRASVSRVGSIEGDAARDAGRVIELGQQAAPFRQRLDRVDVGRADDGPPAAEGVGERPTRDLIAVAVRRDAPGRGAPGLGARAGRRRAEKAALEAAGRLPCAPLVEALRSRLERKNAPKTCSRMSGWRNGTCAGGRCSWKGWPAS
jgi:hypothetical protein